MGLLESYQPQEACQEETKERMLAFIARAPDCLFRSCLEGHFTASCWLLSPDDEAVLLTHHRKLGKWLQLGGHADGDEDLAEVALKEASEESGIHDIQLISPGIFDIDIHLIPPYGSDPGHYHYDVRFALRAGTRGFSVSEESLDLAWISIDRRQFRIAC